MTSIAEIATHLRSVLSKTADALARQTGFVQRHSKMGGALFVQSLVFGCLDNPQTKLHGLTQAAASLGLEITPQGVDQRFGPAAATLLQEVLAAAVGVLVVGKEATIPILQRFSVVQIVDSSTIALPVQLAGVWAGCGGTNEGDGAAALKLQVALDLCHGSLQGPFLQDGRSHDRSAPTQALPLPAGGLRLADLGFFSLDVLQDIAAKDAFFLSRLQVQTAVCDLPGQRLELLALLHDQDELDLPVCIGVEHHLSVRLLAVRVAPGVTNERRRKLKAEARRRGQTVSQARLALADWTIYITNAPTSLLSLGEALVLARARWQIELLFKLWKSGGRIDEWRSQKPWRILCEVYAKLLAIVIQHWLVLAGVWNNAERSLVKAAETVRAYALMLASGMAGVLDLAVVITQIIACLSAGCRLNPRRKQPNTYQLLLALDQAALG